MAHVRKGMLVPSPQWWKHLRDWKRIFWKRHRKGRNSAQWRNGNAVSCNLTTSRLDTGLRLQPRSSTG